MVIAVVEDWICDGFSWVYSFIGGLLNKDKLAVFIEQQDLKFFY